MSLIIILFLIKDIPKQYTLVNMFLENYLIFEKVYSENKTALSILHDS